MITTSSSTSLFGMSVRGNSADDVEDAANFLVHDFFASLPNPFGVGGIVAHRDTVFAAWCTSESVSLGYW